MSLISSRFNVQLVVISNFKSYPVCNRTFHKHIASRKNFDLGKAPRQKSKFLLEVKILSNLFIFQIDTVELWEAQSKNPGPLDYQISQGSTAFAEELQAQDLVFRMDAGRITKILAHPEEPSHVLNIKRGILSAFQVQFVDDHATLEEVRSSLC